MGDRAEFYFKQSFERLQAASSLKKRLQDEVSRNRSFSREINKMHSVHSGLEQYKQQYELLNKQTETLKNKLKEQEKEFKIELNKSNRAYEGKIRDLNDKIAVLKDRLHYFSHFERIKVEQDQVIEQLSAELEEKKQIWSKELNEVKFEYESRYDKMKGKAQLNLKSNLEKCEMKVGDYFKHFEQLLLKQNELLRVELDSSHEYIERQAKQLKKKEKTIFELQEEFGFQKELIEALQAKIKHIPQKQTEVVVEKRQEKSERRYNKAKLELEATRVLENRVKKLEAALLRKDREILEVERRTRKAINNAKKIEKDFGYIVELLEHNLKVIDRNNKVKLSLGANTLNLKEDGEKEHLDMGAQILRAANKLKIKKIKIFDSFRREDRNNSRSLVVERSVSRFN